MPGKYHAIFLCLEDPYPSCIFSCGQFWQRKEHKTWNKQSPKTCKLKHTYTHHIKRTLCRFSPTLRAGSTRSLSRHTTTFTWTDWLSLAWPVTEKTQWHGRHLYHMTCALRRIISSINSCKQTNKQKNGQLIILGIFRKSLYFVSWHTKKPQNKNKVK